MSDRRHNGIVSISVPAVKMSVQHNPVQDRSSRDAQHHGQNQLSEQTGLGWHGRRLPLTSEA